VSARAEVKRVRVGDPWMPWQVSLGGDLVGFYSTWESAMKVACMALLGKARPLSGARL